jgi:Cd2+/Zn2+-exporting ATPase
MAFDKTGTLTKSDLRVNKVESYDGLTKMELIEIVSIVEKKSSHPVAQAVQREAARLKIGEEDGTNYREFSGMGVECDSSHGHIKAGTYEYAGDGGMSASATVYVSLDGKCIGYIGVGDTIKENGKKAFDALRANGIEKIYVLSGDKKSKVDIVASTLYADGAYSQLLPEHKLDALEDIIENGNDVKIGYCGDGINDIPCLSRADVGISMGTVGVDSAVEKSDVVIADDDIEKVSLALGISRNVKKRVITNIALAISVKAIFAILNIVVPSFPMSLAVFADVGVLLITILSALNAGKKSKLE